MNHKKQLGVSLLLGLAAGMVAVSTSPSARANVYATNIKLNGSITNNATGTVGSAVSISYILNEPATAGATINILSNNVTVDTFAIAPGVTGTLLGKNVISWDGKLTGGATAAAGTYGVSVTVGATGYTNWTQTSVDGTNNTVVFSHGMDVDKNTNSPYYGRIVVGNNTVATTRGVAMNIGLYKYNTDFSPADEGAFGYAGFNTNDSGSAYTNQMSGARGVSTGHNLTTPYCIRIAEDDRIYFADNSYWGAIVATDMTASTNQIVITEGLGNASDSPALPASPEYPNAPSYAGNAFAGQLNQLGSGIKTFDILGANTTNASLYLVDFGDFPNWGIWMFHMTNGAVDTNDNAGTQVIATGGSLAFVTGGGITLDTNLDVFCSQYRGNTGDTSIRSFKFTNWNGGVLPPENDGQNVAMDGVSQGPTPTYAIGSANDSLCNIKDTIIDNRRNPKYVALPEIPSTGTTSGGIAVINAVDGSYVTVTNGGSITQTLTNLDYPQQYFGAAWDNVGNLYGCSTTANYIRVFSPPGTNVATTIAHPTITLATATTPFSLGAASVSSGGGTITINFTASSSLATTAFTLYGSPTVTPASGYAAIPSATFTSLGGGAFKVTAPATSAAQFYRISHN